MTRVDFYILDDLSEQARERFACRLVEKIWPMKHRIYLHTDSEHAARRMDQLLWTFQDSSFIPHVLAARELDKSLADATPVCIGTGDKADFEADILVNLDRNVPLFFSRFERVAEIVSGTENDKSMARERFRFYRDRGYTLRTHSIGVGR